MDIFLKVLRKIGVAPLIYKGLAPLCIRTMNVDNSNILHSFELLSSVSKDSDNSCICANIVDKKPEYDLHIIIPAYNVEKYISSCIESVLNQKTGYKYFVTIVNDGSMDRTGEILQKYTSYPNIEIITQSNKGFSGARNTALSHIRGKYVTFLDSDDMLVDDAINSLMQAAYKYNADVVEGGFTVFYNNRTIYSFKHRLTGETPKWYGVLYGYPWGKVFKSELFENIHFPEKYWFEDSIVSMIIYPKCHEIVTIKDVVYRYRRNYKGISQTSKGNPKVLDSFWITERLMKDRAEMGLTNDDNMNEFILDQFKLNFKRIHTLRNEDIDKANFVLSVALFEKYFSYPVGTNNNEILHAIKIRNFGLFRMACLLT